MKKVSKPNANLKQNETNPTHLLGIPLPIPEFHVSSPTNDAFFFLTYVEDGLTFICSDMKIGA